MEYIVISYAVFIIWTIIELATAPKGYEDETGFHYGQPRRK